MDRRALDSTRAGREALAKLDRWLNYFLLVYGPEWQWRSDLLRSRILDHCRAAVEYDPQWDPNNQARQRALQGRASRGDIKEAIGTVLDAIDLYDPALRVRLDQAYSSSLPEGTRPHAPGHSVLNRLLLKLEQIVDDDSIPAPTLRPHDPVAFHYRLGPLQFPAPLTLIKHKPDPVHTGLVFAIEAELRLIVKSPRTCWLEYGDRMPEGHLRYDITAAFIRATIDPSATPRKTKARMEKLLSDYPGLQWIGWPSPALLGMPRTTSQIRTRRKAR